MSLFVTVYLALCCWSVVQTVIIYQKHCKIMRLLGTVHELRRELAELHAELEELADE